MGQLGFFFWSFYGGSTPRRQGQEIERKRKNLLNNLGKIKDFRPVNFVRICKKLEGHPEAFFEARRF